MPKTYVFELVGGPYDGTYRSDSVDARESVMARGFYAMSGKGRIGAVLNGLAPPAPDTQYRIDPAASHHDYQVTDRRLIGHVIHVKCQHHWKT